MTVLEQAILIIASIAASIFLGTAIGGWLGFFVVIIGSFVGINIVCDKSCELKDKYAKASRNGLSPVSHDDVLKARDKYHEAQDKYRKEQHEAQQFNESVKKSANMLESSDLMKAIWQDLIRNVKFKLEINPEDPSEKNIEDQYIVRHFFWSQSLKVDETGYALSKFNRDDSCVFVHEQNYHALGYINRTKQEEVVAIGALIVKAIGEEFKKKYPTCDVRAVEHGNRSGPYCCRVTVSDNKKIANPNYNPQLKTM